MLRENPRRRITDGPPRPALEKILSDGLINFLFVGRIVPNKRIEDHIRLAEVYKRYVDSYYRFIFVGRYDGMPATRDFTATLRLAERPQSITLDGASVTNAVWDAAAGTLTAAIPVCGLKPRVLVCE